MLAYADVCWRMLTYRLFRLGCRGLLLFCFSIYIVPLLFPCFRISLYFCLIFSFFFSFSSWFSVLFFCYDAGSWRFVHVTCMCVRVNACVVQVNRVRHHHVRAVLRALEKSGFVDVVPGRLLFFLL